MYAIKQNGAWRAVTSDTVLDADETFSETVPEPTPEQKQAEVLKAFEAVVNGYIQQTVAPKNYKSIDRAPLYVDDPEWGAEAQALIVWNRDVWRKAYSIMNACLAGEREIPTGEELIADLPVMVWPS